jgi:hypothetical protein
MRKRQGAFCAASRADRTPPRGKAPSTPVARSQRAVRRGGAPVLR